ncbi:DUF3168 domain-containing protein [Sphingomonas sp. PB2P19]|uniref:tail completion protein gp17 n=1 Tax=Sphingomonas rhamnosi TaxID=3096156 RepID=UPI002FC5EAB3
MTADLRDRFKAAGVAGGRVYRDVRPQGSAMPAVRMQQVSDIVGDLMKGESLLRETLIQVDAFASSRSEADAIAEAIAAARPAKEVVGGTDFRRIFIDGGDTDSETPASGGTIYRTRIDLLVWHRPARQED